ncbi:hypothetical protein M0813_06684 [Anaeramoeba flamelloides]|uniref:Uncharacterized protein n=1 Tax=Anaeramoeba flamelloides TaxID=1746091 RepID=A0ABQ8XCS5_9EUKA|nr:hypothetical protein M0813_06684 [Anaeramoeba flamelloides]
MEQSRSFSNKKGDELSSFPIISERKQQTTQIIESSDLILGRLLVMMKFSIIDDKDKCLGVNKDLLLRTTKKNHLFFQDNQVVPFSDEYKCNTPIKQEEQTQLFGINNTAQGSGMYLHENPKQEKMNYLIKMPQQKKKSVKIFQNIANHMIQELKDNNAKQQDYSELDHQKNMITLDQEMDIQKNDLINFLNQKPKPNWGRRLYYLKRYDKTLVQGFPEYIFSKNNSCIKQFEKKIVINKRIFPLLIEITKGIKKNEDLNLYKNAYKSCQRGLIEWFRRKNYKNKIRYSREKMEFIPSTH